MPAVHERPDDAVEPVRPGAESGVLRVNERAGGRAERVRLGVRGAVPDLQRGVRTVQPDEPRGSRAGLCAPLACGERVWREKLCANERRELHTLHVFRIRIHLVQPEHDGRRAGDRRGRTSSYYTGFPCGADAVGYMGAGGGGWLGPGGASQACAGGTGGTGGAIPGFGLGAVGLGGAGGSNSTHCTGAGGLNATSYGSGGGGGNSGGAGGNDESMQQKNRNVVFFT